MEKEISIKNIMMLKDRAIIDIGEKYSYLIDFDKFATSKPNFMVNKDEVVYPNGYVLWFDSYKEDIDVIEFKINGNLKDDNGYMTYEIKGFINMEGEISNCFEISIPSETFEVYLKQEDCYDSNKIINGCLSALEIYYKPYQKVIYQDETTKEVKQFDQ